MKRLVTGTGRRGTTWDIRGSQLGAAIGATVDPNPQRLMGYDQVILVKRPKPDVQAMAINARIPLIYDVVDAWQSRLGNDCSRTTCMKWLQNHVATIHPAAIVTATETMASDCADMGLPVLALPHHARPDQAMNPIREKVTTVGYEGSERYLGQWKQVIEQECSRRNWKFVINPPALADLDIVVAMRSENGYAARHWKSNVKLANAQGSGTPCVLNRERGYLETACGAESWADDAAELVLALDALEDHTGREHRSRRLKAAAPQLRDIAKRYEGWLNAL